MPSPDPAPAPPEATDAPGAPSTPKPASRPAAAAAAPAPAPAPEPEPEPEPQPDPEPQPKFKRGDILTIPCHHGTYTAEVVKTYPSLDAAHDSYHLSYTSILQAPRKQPKADQFFYYCEVTNSTRKHLGVAEEHATLQHRPSSTPAS